MTLPACIVVCEKQRMELIDLRAVSHHPLLKCLLVLD